jgi:hypothetical protein
MCRQFADERRSSAAIHRRRSGKSTRLSAETDFVEGAALSVLTKIFVVLNSILTVVLSAGLIVFVTRAEEFNKKVEAAKASEVTQRELRLAAEQQVAGAEGARDLAIANAAAEIKIYQTDVANAVMLRKQAEAQAASANQEATTAKAQALTAEQAAKSATDTIAEQQKIINQTANESRQLAKDKADLQTQVAGDIKDIEGLRAANRRQKEEIAMLQAKYDDVVSKTRTTQQAGTGTEQQPGVNGGIAPVAGNFLNLRGVIKGRKRINDVEYATISLGAAQKVEKGMKFNVSDGSNFLGYLTVDLVETDQSVGHLEGPSLSMVRPGSEVRTQW